MEIINIFIEFVNAFLHMYIGYVFYSSFWDSNHKKPTVILTVGISTILLTVSLLLFKGSVLMYIPMTILSFVLTLLFNSKITNKILCTFLYLVIPGVVEMIVGILISTVFKISIDVAKDNTAYYISGMLISKLIVFLIVLFIRTKKQNALLRHYKINYLSIFLFPASTLAVAAVQHKIFIEYPNQDMLTKYWFLISYTILILANIIVFDFINTLYRNTVNESKIKTANEIIENQTIQYQSLIEHNNNIMRIRHDHKNFCIGLMSELKNGNIDAAIERLNKEYDINKSEHLMQFDIVHSIVNIKQQISSEYGIELVLDCDNLNKINILSTDLAIVLGNALDNAIEASKKVQTNTKKLIEILIYLKNDVVFITIKNPVQKSIDTNNLTSTKKSENHGFGIVSMKQIANKYNGDVMFSCEDCVFTTMIMLRNKIL